MLDKLITYLRERHYEREWLKEKPCAACHHFNYYIASAGICTAKSGCSATSMRDAMDICDCGMFKKRERRRI